jgi:hypothetical protein
MADYSYFRKLATDQVKEYSAVLEAEEDFAAGLELLRYSESQLRDEKQALEAQLRDEKQALEAQLQDQKLTLEAQLRDEKQALEAQLQDQKLTLEAQLRDEKQALEAQLQDQKLTLEAQLQKLNDKYENLIKAQREAFQASIRAAEETAKLERDAGILIGEKRASSQHAHELAHHKNLVAKLRRAFFLRRMSRRRRLVRILLPSRLRSWWDRRNVDRFTQLIASSGKFDARWYLATYPDVAASGVDPIRHYLEFGAPEGRNPSPDFDTTSYLADHPMLSVWGLNPFVAFIVAEQHKEISQSTNVQVVQKRKA